MKIWDCLSERGKKEWPRIYKKFKRKAWISPSKDERAIVCEPKLESTEEIGRQIREKPNYVIEKQGREG